MLSKVNVLVPANMDDDPTPLFYCKKKGWLKEKELYIAFETKEEFEKFILKTIDAGINVGRAGYYKSSEVSKPIIQEYIKSLT